MPRVLGGSEGCGRFLMGEVPLSAADKTEKFYKESEWCCRVCPRISKCAQEHLEVCLGRTRCWHLTFLFITLKPRFESCKKSMRLKYEPASEPLHFLVK